MMVDCEMVMVRDGWMVSDILYENEMVDYHFEMMVEG